MKLIRFGRYRLILLPPSLCGLSENESIYPRSVPFSFLSTKWFLNQGKNYFLPVLGGNKSCLKFKLKVLILNLSWTMGELYEQHKDEDGFLYIAYSGENTFGHLWFQFEKFWNLDHICSIDSFITFISSVLTIISLNSAIYVSQKYY